MYEMITEFYHLSLRPQKTVHFDEAHASDMQALLKQATGCVVGHSGGTPYVDLIVGMETHRLEFSTEKARLAFINEAVHHNVAIHRTRDLIVTFFLVGILVAIVVAGLVAVPAFR